MDLGPPSNIDDFGPSPAEQTLKAAFRTLWNDSSEKGSYLGAYVASDPSNPNYIDPRDKAPTSDPIPVPWNGFPKAMSRWFDDDASDANKAAAEAAADQLVPKWQWVQPDPSTGKLRLFSCAPHQVPYFADILGPHVKKLAGPRRYLKDDGTLGGSFVEQYRQQDEYLEWMAEHDAAGDVVKLTFTAEPPDYWMALAHTSKDKVTELYKNIVSTDVTADALFFPFDVVAAGIDSAGKFQWVKTNSKGDYNPLNVWTTSKGILHLTHWANTLGAEVHLAQDASHIFACDAMAAPGPNDPPVQVRRIACGEYGGINRSSDPLIGLGVGDQANSGHKVTLTDPVGLYVLRCDLSGLKGPQNQAVGNTAFSLVRGSNDAAAPRILRFAVAAQAGSGFVLGDCAIDGRKIVRGGQIARQTQMGLYAQIYDDAPDATATGCAAIPCRDPDHLDLFTTSRRGQGGASVCPVAGATDWLAEAPYLSVPADHHAFAEAFALDLHQDLVGDKATVWTDAVVSKRLSRTVLK